MTGDKALKSFCIEKSVTLETTHDPTLADNGQMSAFTQPNYKTFQPIMLLHRRKCTIYGKKRLFKP